MTRKGQKLAEEQVGAQDPNAASTNMTIEQMYLAMIQKQQEIESFMLKMMLGQQALEKNWNSKRRSSRRSEKSVRGMRAG